MKGEVKSKHVTNNFSFRQKGYFFRKYIKVLRHCKVMAYTQIEYSTVLIQVESRLNDPLFTY